MRRLYPLIPRLTWLYCYCLLTLLSCEKSVRLVLPLEVLNSSTDLKLNTVYFTDAQNGYILGGDSWYMGIQLRTTDGGDSWTADSLAAAELLALDFSAEGTGYAVGIGGRLLRKPSPDKPWEKATPIPWRTHRDLCFFDDQHGIIVGGAAFQHGLILRIGANHQLVAIDSFENELAAVCYSDSSTIHVMGYGLILRSTDGGESWQPNSLTGDFFQALHFPSSSVGYAVGLTGTIIKTMDAGASWTKLRNGDDWGQQRLYFRSVFFTNEQKGYIVGDEGTFLRTLDGGQTWQSIETPTKADLLDIHVINETGYIVGSNGVIIRFSDL